jgi:hypothetical protein
MALPINSTIDDPELIGLDGSIFNGGLGAPQGTLADLLREDITYAPGYYPGRGIMVDESDVDRLGLGGNIFLSNPNWAGLTAPISTVSRGPAANELTGAVPAISPGGAQVTGGDTTIEVPTVRGEILTSEQLQGIIKGRLDAKQMEIGRGLTETQANNIIDDVFEELYGRTPFGGVNKPRTQGGIPLVIPLPVDPVTGLIITAVGLLASGGNVAKLNPNDPLGSLVDAAKGTAGAVGNVVDVITDPVGAINRMGTQPGGTTGSGQATTNTPVAIGTGALGGSSSGAGVTVGGGQTTTGTGIAVGTGAVGGVTGGGDVGGNASVAPTGTPSSVGSGKKGGDVSLIDQVTPVTGGPFVIGSTPSSVGSGKKGGDVSVIDDVTPVVTGGFKDVEPKTCPAGQQLDASGNCVPITPPPPPPPSNPPPSTPIFTPVPTFTFTKTTPGDVAMRDFQKEFGLTSSTLMGQAGQDLAKYYQQLQAQFTPSTLTALAGTSEQQLQNDLSRYEAAMQGQLSPEDIRAAQQGAREAYAARGQVFSPGAVGAEILGRDQLMRQRQAEARQNLQQSMGNVGAAAQLQTGNIFAPFANLLAKTYSPTSEYANAVYDYNVNAYNAYQAAQENLAAYKEAAAKGEQAQFINTFANFLANNGIQTTQNALSKFFQALLPKG